MLRRLLNFTELLIYLLLTLFFGAISLYRYSFPDTIDKSETKEISVVLLSKPAYHDGGEYSDPEISFEAKSYSGIFKVNEYAPILRWTDEIKKLNAGDSLKFLVRKALDKTAKKSIEVFGISTFQNKKLLTLDEYNHAKKNKWTDIWLPVLIFNLLLLPSIIRQLIKRKSTAAKSGR